MPMPTARSADAGKSGSSSALIHQSQPMSQWPPPASSTKPPFDPSLRFVRLRKVRSDGFVEFDFAVGEPDLLVELVMPVAAFHEFCRANHVIQIAPLEDAATIAGSEPPDSASGA